MAAWQARAGGLQRGKQRTEQGFLRPLPVALASVALGGLLLLLRVRARVGPAASAAAWPGSGAHEHAPRTPYTRDAAGAEEA